MGVRLLHRLSATALLLFPIPALGETSSFPKEQTEVWITNEPSQSLLSISAVSSLLTAPRRTAQLALSCPTDDEPIGTLRIGGIDIDNEGSMTIEAGGHSFPVSYSSFPGYPKNNEALVWYKFDSDRDYMSLLLTLTSEKTFDIRWTLANGQDNRLLLHLPSLEKWKIDSKETMLLRCVWPKGD